MIIRNNSNEKKISESDFYDYLRFAVLEGFADESVDVMAVQFLISWMFQITTISIGFSTDNCWLDVSCGDKCVKLYNIGIEKDLINQFRLNEQRRIL